MMLWNMNIRDVPSIWEKAIYTDAEETSEAAQHSHGRRLSVHYFFVCIEKRVAMFIYRKMFSQAIHYIHIHRSMFIQYRQCRYSYISIQAVHTRT